MTRGMTSKRLALLIAVIGILSACGRTPKGGDNLVQAVRGGDRVLIVRLLDEGADPLASGRDGLTPLAAAVMGGDREIIGTLLQAVPEEETTLELALLSMLLRSTERQPEEAASAGPGPAAAAAAELKSSMEAQFDRLNRRIQTAIDSAASSSSLVGRYLAGLDDLRTELSGTAAGLRQEMEREAGRLDAKIGAMEPVTRTEPGDGSGDVSIPLSTAGIRADMEAEITRLDEKIDAALGRAAEEAARLEQYVRSYAGGLNGRTDILTADDLSAAETRLKNELYEQLLSELTDIIAAGRDELKAEIDAADHADLLRLTDILGDR